MVVSIIIDHTLNSLIKHHKEYNYLENPLLSSYFLSKEARAYYLSLKHVDVKRDYHAKLISHIKDFLSLINNNSIEILNYFIFSKTCQKRQNFSDSNLSTIFEIMHPQGYELLEIKFPLTLESLKVCYRKSAMKHHPDRGGSHQNMLIINEAYTIYQDYLCNKQSGIRNVLNDSFNNNIYAIPHHANDYIYLLNSLLSEVYCDEWDLMNAYQTVKNIQNFNFYGSDLVKTVEEIYKVIKMASSLTQRLAFANLKSEANEMMCFTKFIYQLGDFDYQPYIDDPKNIINGVKKLRVILNHKRQADNALLYNVISTKKYMSILERFEKNEKILKEKEVILQTFLSSVGFTEDLIYEDGAIKSSLSLIDIPEVGYYDNKKLHALSEEQQTEYFLAFSKKSSLVLVKKYIYVRLASYILSIGINFNQKVIDNILIECSLLSEIFDTYQRKDSYTSILRTDLRKICRKSQV